TRCLSDWSSDVCSSDLARFDRRAKDDGTFFVSQISLRDGENLFARDGEKSVQDSVHQLRIVVEEREAGEKMHQSIFRHIPAAATLERRVIIRAPLHFQLFQFVRADSVLLNFADYGVKGFQRRMARILGLVNYAGGHLRRPVV